MNLCFRNMAKYAVVEFIKSNTVDIVPVSWLSSEEDKSAWPPFKSDKVGPLVRELHEADSTWKYHAVKVLGKAGELNLATMIYYTECCLILKIA